MCSRISRPYYFCHKIDETIVILFLRMQTTQIFPSDLLMKIDSFVNYLFPWCVCVRAAVSDSLCVYIFRFAFEYLKFVHCTSLFPFIRSTRCEI